MSDKSSEKKQLFEEAFDLIIRLQGESGNQAVHNQIARWRARDAEHEQVWQRAIAIHGMAGHAVQKQHVFQPRKKQVTRRAFMAGGAALATVTVGSIVVPQALMYLRADYVTTTAEMRNVVLDDGTRVVLGPKSAMSSTMTPDMRSINVLEGMAYVDVARDVLRPFHATIGDLHVTALGTAFDLGYDAKTRRVAVDHGQVLVKTVQGSDAEIVSAGQWLSVQNGLPVERGVTNTSLVASWRSGMLVAENDTIAAVVARIGRWQPGRVVIAHAALANQRISGVYDLQQPLNALQALVQPLGGQVRQFSPWLTVISEA